jgi:hypothetical protein
MLAWFLSCKTPNLYFKRHELKLMVTGFMGESPSKAPVLDAPDFAVPAAGAGGETTSTVRPEEQVISGSMISK